MLTLPGVSGPLWIEPPDACGSQSLDGGTAVRPRERLGGATQVLSPDPDPPVSTVSA